MKLIDADEFESYLITRYGGNDTGDEIIEDLTHQPTVDAVQVVRCKDCKNYNAGFECLIEGYGIERDKDWFCADAERREDGRK